ncbi:MAG TPA: hypothetical protein DEB06_09920 [Phycisphaerales bacterium]|nr:hypothetical protein [Phycisphaerales bacterium]
MTLPVHDWQFWAATAGAGFAAYWVLRGLVGALFGGRGRRRRPRSRRATLTIEGRQRESK